MRACNHHGMTTCPNCERVALLKRRLLSYPFNQEELMSQRYVQHISGQGEKFELEPERSEEEPERMPHEGELWRIKYNRYHFNFLPKSEYRECEPPVVYRDVTAECDIDHVVGFNLYHPPLTFPILTITVEARRAGYRLRKKYSDALTLELREKD